MAKNPDRYTVIEVDPEVLPQRIEQARALGSHWIVRSDGENSRSHRSAYLYLFFDEKGMNAYMSGQWGSVPDEIAHNVELVRGGEMDLDFFLHRTADLLGVDMGAQE